MLDCYMALDLNYAAALASKLEASTADMLWLEEPFLPDDLQSHIRLQKRMQNGRIILATGEHEYTRWGFLELLKNEGASLLQPDVMWMGGPTEFARVVHLAESFGVSLIPHGCGVYGYHMAMAFSHAPMCEFMMMSEHGDKIEPNFGTMFKSEPLPEGGYITLDHNAPGFGLELNKEALNLQRPYTHEPRLSNIEQPEKKRKR